LPIVVAVTLLFAAFLLFSGKIGRLAGILMVVGYVCFFGVQYLL